MAALADFQLAFASAIDRNGGRARGGRADRLEAQPGFAVYRNITPEGLIGALRGNYPVTGEIVGDEAFDALAFDYARRHPIRSCSNMANGLPTSSRRSRGSTSCPTFRTSRGSSGSGPKPISPPTPTRWTWPTWHRSAQTAGWRSGCRCIRRLASPGCARRR
jgi:hypothetical protein